MEEQVSLWRLLFAQRGLSMFQAAHEALAEYGGLKATRERLPEQVDTQYPFDLNPELLLQEAWKVGSAELVLGYAIYPIGKIYHAAGASHLYIDEQGGISLFEGAALVFVAPSLREALACFILGQWPVHPFPGPPLTRIAPPWKDRGPPRPEAPCVTRMLEHAGWYPGRRVEEQVEAWRRLFEPRGLHMFQAAREALLEYGGLKLTDEAVIEGKRLPQVCFDLNPELLLGMEKTLISTVEGIEYTMYPMGELDCPIPGLFIDAQGGIHLFAGKPRFVARSLREALGRFIAGPA